MGYAAAHAAIRLRFESEWGSTTPVQMPNTTNEPPASGSWVRFVIDVARSDWASAGDPGNNTERNLGQVTVQIFAESGDGEGVAVELADQAKAIFRSWRDVSSGVRFLVPPYARRIGPSKKWYQINVVAPFQFDDFT